MNETPSAGDGKNDSSERFTGRGERMELTLDGQTIGPDERPLVIAELGTNFRDDLQLAKRLVEVAAEVGADAVKFQTHIQKAEMAESAMRELGFGDLYERIGTYELSAAEHRELKRHCADHGLMFLSTPFSVEAVSRLDDIGVPAIKIGSGELTNYPLLRTAAKTGSPLLVSIGMADFETIEDAVAFVRQYTDDIALFYCISEYPTEPETFEFGVIDRLRSTFEVPVGFSNHAAGVEVPAIAMARGADMVEAHFTIDRRLPGGDPEVSLEPAEFRELTDFAALVARTAGDERVPTAAERETAAWAHHSVVTTEAVEAGEELTAAKLTIKRPGTGIPATEFDDVLGRHTYETLAADTVLEPDHLRE
jgi:N-acetylneuraminate synthase/N,N'-diacetyllegionaminate synthase